MSVEVGHLLIGRLVVRSQAATFHYMNYLLNTENKDTLNSRFTMPSHSKKINKLAKQNKTKLNEAKQNNT